MGDSIEKRRCKRMKTDLSLNVSNLFRQDNIKISDIDSPIEVIDISKSGIGFISKSTLPIGYYFNAAIQLGSETDTLYCVVKIVRQQSLNHSGNFSYGCEFVGMSSVLDYIFDEYEADIAN
jgi:hypothetical protein